MAHSNVNASIDPQLQQHYHDGQPRHAADNHHHHYTTTTPTNTTSTHSTHPSTHQQTHHPLASNSSSEGPHQHHPPPPHSRGAGLAQHHGGYPLHAPQLVDAQDEDADDGDSIGDDGSAQASPEDTTNAGESGKTPEKRPRACDSCRGLKVKCIIDPASGLPCKRCAKARRQCIVTPPTRKRQKKADSRVAELERKIDALTATLAAREASVYDGGIQLQELKTGSASPYAAHRSPQYTTDQKILSGAAAPSPRLARPDVRPNEGSDKRRRLSKLNTERDVSTADSLSIAAYTDSYKTIAGANDVSSLIPTPSSDPEGRGSIYNQKKPETFDHADIDQRIDDIIDRDTANRLFTRYVNDVVPRFPAVPFPPGTDPALIRKEKPVLFLAILSSTSFGTGVSHMAQKKLEAELRDVFAKAMWKHGEKSLELVQALHVATLWYRPPANFEQHMFYQMVHMSAVMAIDIGIGKRMSPWRRKWFGGDPPPTRRPHFYDSIEAKRAWVVCYFLCISITMILRRPILVRFTDYLKECIEILETSEDALPSDKTLCQHVRIAHICEDIATQFAMDDPAINYTVSDHNVTFGIKHYEKSLAEIRNLPGSQDYAVRLADHVTNLYLHEIALHSQSNVDDFKGPWVAETFKTAVGDTVLGPEHIRALTACQQACRNILDTFLSYDFEVIYVLPVIFSVRIVYAVVVIIKLYIAANSPGEIATVIKKEDLHVEEYLDKLQKVFRRVMSQDALSPHVKFLWVIERLQERWKNIKDGKNTICRSGGKSTPLSETRPPASSSAASMDQKLAQQQHEIPPAAQGLHLLSEAAMTNQPPPQQQQTNGNNTNDNTTDPSLLAHPQPQQWYTQQQAPALNLPMDPNAFYYNAVGYDGFDYGIGMLGSTMDGAIGGLFLPDAMWGFGQQPDPNNPQHGGFGQWG